MSENKTLPTDVPVEAFIEALPVEKRKVEAEQLIDMMRHITGCDPVMWGASIIGFGQYDYHYKSGRKGTFLRLGFAPQKTKLSIYCMPGFDGLKDELARLGKHKHSVGCLYINKLPDVDFDVLTEICAGIWQQMNDMYPE